MASGVEFSTYDIILMLKIFWILDIRIKVAQPAVMVLQ
jgi:hypothetical protein